MTAGDVKQHRRPTRVQWSRFLGRCKAAGDQFRDGLHVSIVEDIRSIKAVAISTMEICRHKFPNRGQQFASNGPASATWD